MSINFKVLIFFPIGAQDSSQTCVSRAKQRTKPCGFGKLSRIIRIGNNIGKPDKDDWITSIEAQALVYALVVDTIELIEILVE